MEIKGTEHQGIPIRPKGSLTPAGKSPAAATDKQLWKACQGFEALFMGYLVKSMQRTLPQGTLSSSGLPDLMFDQIMGSAMSEGGGIGLAELLYRDLQSKTYHDSTENDDGISLQELLTRNVRKGKNDQASSR